MASLTEENWKYDPQVERLLRYLYLTSRSAAQQAEEELLAALAPKDLIPKDVGVNIARYVVPG